MHRIASSRVWVILAVSLFSIWGEPSAEAQLFRSRRKCCCAKSCKDCACPRDPCCTRDQAIACMIDEIWNSPGYYLYYAHYHQDGAQCPEYEGCILEWYEDRDEPEICAGQCKPFARGRSSLRGPDESVGTNEELQQLMRNSNATQIEELAGDLMMPDMTKIHVRVLVLHVKAKVKVTNDAEPTEVSEYFGFGFESEPTNRQDFPVRTLKKHKVGTDEQHNLYEFNIGTLKCVVLKARS